MKKLAQYGKIARRPGRDGARWLSRYLSLQPDYPELALTNNHAERALRHMGHRAAHRHGNPQRTRACALLASHFETSPERGASLWSDIAEVVRQRHRGLPAPPLPAPDG